MSSTGNLCEYGLLTVITGPMYSEKSGELIRRCEKLQKYGKKKVKVYKPINDNRFSGDKVVSRIGYTIPAENLNTELLEEDLYMVLCEAECFDVIAFDEAQFFQKNIMKLVSELTAEGKHVIIAGLDMDYRGMEFGYMGGLLAMADEVIKQTAYCACCGLSAKFTQRLINNKPARKGPIVLVGDKESYEPRCRKCFIPPHKA